MKSKRLARKQTEVTNAEFSDSGQNTVRSQLKAVGEEMENRESEGNTAELESVGFAD